MIENDMARAIQAVVVACCCTFWAVPALAQEVPANDPAPAAAADVSASEGPTEPGGSDGAAEAGDARDTGVAAEPEEKDEELPWNRDTTPTARKRAQELFKLGNRRANDDLTLLAIDSYQAALELWPNPVIYFNLARAEVKANRLGDAAQHLKRALQHGATPLGDDEETSAARMKEGQDRLADILSQITEIEIVCPLPGTTVFLGKRQLTMKNGRFKGLVNVGSYSLVAAKDGYENDVRQIVLSSGQSAHYVISPMERVTVRRFSPWVPRGVFGFTIAAALVAGIFHGMAVGTFGGYDDDVDRIDGPAGPSVVENKRERVAGERQRAIAGVAYLTAGVSLIAATALYLSNRPRTELRAPVPTEASVSIAPTLGHDRFGIRATLTF